MMDLSNFVETEPKVRAAGTGANALSFVTISTNAKMLTISGAALHKILGKDTEVAEGDEYVCRVLLNPETKVLAISMAEEGKCTLKVRGTKNHSGSIKTDLSAIADPKSETKTRALLVADGEYFVADLLADTCKQLAKKPGPAKWQGKAKAAGKKKK